MKFLKKVFSKKNKLPRLGGYDLDDKGYVNQKLGKRVKTFLEPSGPAEVKS